MSRELTRKKRGVVRKKRRPVMLILLEGKANKTECNYFQSLKKNRTSYVLELYRPGNTDPKSMIEAIDKRWSRDDLSEELGDCCFVVLDMDCSITKKRYIDQLSVEKRTKLVVSNPSFEFWYLLHFCETTREFLNQDDLIKKLKEYVPDYEKNMNLEIQLRANARIAIRRARKIDNMVDKSNRGVCASFTEVYYIVEKILGERC